MIFEYAIDPEVVTTWGQIDNARIFRNSFGVGQSRLMSAFPNASQWRKAFGKVLDARKQAMGDMEIHRAVEKASALLETSVTRQNIAYQYDGRSWLQNAIVAGLRYPFQGILANANPDGNEQVIVASEVELSDIPRWDVRRAATPNRSVAEISSDLAPMLRIARDVVIVDPYFRANKRERRLVLEGLFDRILDGRTVEPPKSVAVLVAANYDRAPTRQAFDYECQSKMPEHIAHGLRVSFIRLVEKQGGERLHNRYVLTNHGGVKFGNTFEIDDPGASDDANLMDGKQYLLRAAQHFPIVASGCVTIPGFDIDGNIAPVEVIGKKRAR